MSSFLQSNCTIMQRSTLSAEPHEDQRFRDVAQGWEDQTPVFELLVIEKMQWRSTANGKRQENTSTVTIECEEQRTTERNDLPRPAPSRVSWTLGLMFEGRALGLRARFRAFLLLKISRCGSLRTSVMYHTAAHKVHIISPEICASAPDRTNVC